MPRLPLLLSLFLSCLAGAAAAQSGGAATADAPPPAATAPAARAALPPAVAAQAEANYARYCVLCHGADREGHANDHAPSLRSKSLLESAQGRLLAETIAYGRPGTPMAGYFTDVGGPMSASEVGALARWLVEREGVAPVPLSAAPVAGDPERGAAVYAEHCAACHGAQGEGGTGTELGNAAMLALTPDAFLRHAIVAGRDGTPMPAFGGTLAPERIDDVVAFLRSRGGDWEKPLGVAVPPGLDDIVLNPGAAAPDFALRDGLYVSAAELRRALDAGRSMVLLDTRVPSVWRLGHIAGAAPLPYYSDTDVIAKLPRDGTWIVAYCECPRAAAESVVRRLRAEGFASTAVLYEGIQGWIALGHPVVAGTTPEGEPDDPHAGHAH